MPRAPRKIVIQARPDGKYCFTPIIQSTTRRTREFDTREEMLEHFWQLLTLTEETYLVEYQPQEAPE